MTGDELSDFLDANGFRTVSLDADNFVERATANPERRNVAVLARRGWVVEFDAEGDFFAPGAHAAIVRELLSKAQIPWTRVDDFWLPSMGRLVTVRLENQGFTAVGKSAASEKPGDYADVGLIVAVAQKASDLLSKGIQFLSIKTGDQTAVLVGLPAQVSALHQLHPLFKCDRSAGDRVTFLDSERAMELLRKKQILTAIGQLGRPSWQLQRQACTPELLEALRANCSDTNELLLRAAGLADRFVVEWALNAAMKVYGTKPRDVSALRETLKQR